MAEHSEIKEIEPLLSKYCPICQRTLVPVNINEVWTGQHDGFIWVHDDIDHTDEDIEAMEAGLQ